MSVIDDTLYRPASNHVHDLLVVVTVIGIKTFLFCSLLLFLLVQLGRCTLIGLRQVVV